MYIARCLGRDSGSFPGNLILSCTIYHFQMVESNQDWSSLPFRARPNTRDLVALLVKSKADSTARRYMKEIMKFVHWCKSFDIQSAPPFPVSTVTAYLCKVYSKSKSYAILSLIHAALKWFHSFVLGNAISSLDSPICHNILEAAKRSKPITVKKSPISADIIREIIDKYYISNHSSNLKDLRLACLCTIGFAGFFRYQELSNIQPNHLEFFPDHLKIFVPQAKNDVYREGNYVYIKKINTKYCPVILLERYIQMGVIDMKSTLPLFRPVRLFKSTNSYKFWGGKFSYTRCREVFKECLKNLGYDEKAYGLHSLRAGGATAVARNSTGNLSERIIKLHGRWKTDVAKDMYILEDTTKRLQITDLLGI